MFKVNNVLKKKPVRVPPLLLQRALATWVWCLALGAGLQLASAIAAAAPTQPLAQPVATLQQIMLELIDPNVDPLWNAVSTEIGPQGVVETAPKTPADWQQLQRHALTLAEVANLLQLPGRPVADGNTSSHHTELQPEAIATLIQANQPAFNAHAQALQQATLRLLQAIERRDLSDYENAGGQIEHACEGCHSQFWYPADKLPPAH
ncbi:cytochrome c [Rheinheimera texasensis]|uniref:cytochrome c n=1 Tax=Rheinheimera texasensis TaxID=306205 RepID=UPI0032B2144F